MMAQPMMVEPPMIRLPVANHEALRSLADCAAAAGAPPASPGRFSAKQARGSPGSRFTPRFSLGNVLGEGSYGVVELCHERYTITPRGTKIYACPAENADAVGTRSNSEHLTSDGKGSCFGTFACKTVHKPACDSNEDPRVLALVREIKVMKHLGKHPNIVQIKGVYNSKERLRLVMELGKSAHILPLDHDGLPEPLAADIFRQLVSAVAHCHLHGVIHRDIKLENVLLTSGMPLKLADFGLAKILKPPESEAIGDTGSKLYKAPEVYERRWYTTQADMWSLGIVLYALLSARFPETDAKTGLLASTTPEVLFKSRLWGTVSAAAKDLIHRLLSFDPAMRPTCEEALRHEWPRVVPPPMQQPLISPMVPPPAATSPTSTATRAETGDAVRRDYDQSSASILDRVWQQLAHEPPASTPRFSVPDFAVPSVKGWGGGRTSGSRLKPKRSPLRSSFRLMSLSSKPAAGSRT
ncbi:unnamed protein product [Closterium sp. Yama58-4]|nr:unnamed protein product [Closterium sp. Yama58-4]